MAKVSKSRISSRVEKIDLQTGVITESLITTTRTRNDLSKGNFTTFVVLFCVFFILLYAVLHSDFIVKEFNDFGELEKVGLNISEDFSFANYLSIFDDNTEFNNFFNEWTSLSFVIPELPEDASGWEEIVNGLLNIGNIILVPIRLLGFVLQSIVNAFTLIFKLFTWG